MLPHAVRNLPLFRHMSARWGDRVLATARIERYAKGAVLFRQGQPATAVWVVLEGWVHLMRSSHATAAAQHSAVLFTITPREALCGISALESGAYQMGAVAGTACRVLRIPREAFAAALREDAGLAYEALVLCARRLQHMAQQYGAVAEPVRVRLVRSILRLREQFGNRIPVTHRELAQMSWTTTESAIRAVRMLKQVGDVAGARGSLLILRPRRLQAALRGARVYDTGHIRASGNGVP